MGFGWPGEKVRLVPLERNRHFENCLRWLNDPQITAGMLSGDFPLVRRAEEEFFDSLGRPGGRQVAFAVETMEEEHIGVAAIRGISFRHGSGRCGVLIGRQQLWGRGYGSDALRVLVGYGLEVVGLRLLLARILADNDRALRIAQKVGFCEVGRLPQRYWKRGSYRDVVLLALRRERPEP